jgi:hypothetical protein
VRYVPQRLCSTGNGITNTLEAKEDKSEKQLERIRHKSPINYARAVCTLIGFLFEEVTEFLSWQRMYCGLGNRCMPFVVHHSVVCALFLSHFVQAELTDAVLAAGTFVVNKFTTYSTFGAALKQTEFFVANYTFGHFILLFANKCCRKRRRSIF